MIAKGNWKSEGWKGQYERAQRFVEKFKAANRIDPKWLTKDPEDYAFSSFQMIYSLKDYLIHDAKISSAIVHEFVKESSGLSKCRDLSNGTKHYLLTHGKSAGKEFDIAYAYPGKDGVFDRIVLIDQRILNIPEFLDSCLSEWLNFVDKHSL